MRKQSKRPVVKISDALDRVGRYHFEETSGSVTRWRGRKFDGQPVHIYAVSDPDLMRKFADITAGEFKEDETQRALSDCLPEVVVIQ